MLEFISCPMCGNKLRVIGYQNKRGAKGFRSVCSMCLTHITAPRPEFVPEVSPDAPKSKSRALPDEEVVIEKIEDEVIKKEDFI